MRIIDNVNYCHAIRLESGDKFLTSLIRFVLKVKARIRSTINENLLLNSYKFSAYFVII